jgi:hypothetical protein
MCGDGVLLVIIQMREIREVAAFRHLIATS